MAVWICARCPLAAAWISLVASRFTQASLGFIIGLTVCRSILLLSAAPCCHWNGSGVLRLSVRPFHVADPAVSRRAARIFTGQNESSLKRPAHPVVFPGKKAVLPVCGQDGVTAFSRRDMPCGSHRSRQALFRCRKEQSGPFQAHRRGRPPKGPSERSARPVGWLSRFCAAPG